MEKSLENKKIAIVHEELTQLGGAERILDVVLEMFPNSPVYTIVWDKTKTNHRYDKKDVRTSFIQRLPLGVKHYKWYLALWPYAVESFDLREFDVIISITSALIKGVKTNKKQLHICYCNTPTRYLWIDSEEYIKNASIPFFIRPFIPMLMKKLRKWDLQAAKRPDYYIGNSKNVSRRIKKIYNLNSDVIYPTIDFNKFNVGPKKDYYLLVSRLRPYKKVEMVIEAFNHLKENLYVVGTGSMEEKLKKMAKSNIRFLGRVSDKELNKLYGEAKGFIFPQEEDFGLTPVEAMASGTPVIAFKAGGALETVKEGVTGEFFYPQDSNSLRQAVIKMSQKKYSAEAMRNWVKNFDNSVFKKELIEYTEGKLNEKSNKRNEE